MVFAGHLDCYKKCNEIIDKFLSIKVSVAQVFRVADFYGEQIGQTIDFSERILSPSLKEEIVYVEADGSMILTRDDGWKEVKLGRIFKSSDCIDPNGEVSWIKHSQYLAHLGNSKTFTAKMDDLLSSYDPSGKRLVFISDGASWIRNWIEDAFPSSVSILDYYHAVEYLYDFAGTHFSDKKKGIVWAQKQERLLKNSKVLKVIGNIEALPDLKKHESLSIIDYYRNNINRMDYKRYSKIGVGIIGSGAIESAHRTVIQKRMKLSGQRWSKQGAQHMLNLRTCSMNEQWSKIIALTKDNFKMAA